MTTPTPAELAATIEVHQARVAMLEEWIQTLEASRKDALVAFPRADDRTTEAQNARELLHRIDDGPSAFTASRIPMPDAVRDGFRKGLPGLTDARQQLAELRQVVKVQAKAQPSPEEHDGARATARKLAADVAKATAERDKASAAVTAALEVAHAAGLDLIGHMDLLSRASAQLGEHCRVWGIPIPPTPERDASKQSRDVAELLARDLLAALRAGKRNPDLAAQLAKSRKEVDGANGEAARAA